jgi:hypothetical protein
MGKRNSRRNFRRRERLSKTILRQGDLLFVNVDEIPEDAREDKTGIIARGEATGHTHMIRPGQRAALMIVAGVAYVTAIKKCAIDHQEHETVILPPGNWEVKRQREYIPDGWRAVAD